jgi:hypothetical protein
MKGVLQIEIGWTILCYLISILLIFCLKYFVALGLAAVTDTGYVSAEARRSFFR